MAEKINQLVDRFIFEMDDKDKSILILKIFCGLCLFYSIFLISIFSFLPGLISERMPLSIFYKYLMFWGTFFVIFALMLSSVSIRGKENIPNIFSTLVVFSTGIMVLGLFHWVGAISSVVIVLLPMLLALSVPFFGKLLLGLTG